MLACAPGPAVDRDGDGAPAQADCADANAEIHPGAPERCDGIDQDCDGSVDEDPVDGVSWHEDQDADGWGGARITVGCEVPRGHVAGGGDCDDLDATVNPGAAETCDGVDQDCDTRVDEDAVDRTDWYLDGDGDGFGTGEPTVACEAPAGTSPVGGDCDDADPAVYPGAAEAVDGADLDCDGEDWVPEVVVVTGLPEAMSGVIGPRCAWDEAGAVAWCSILAGWATVSGAEARNLSVLIRVDGDVATAEAVFEAPVAVGAYDLGVLGDTVVWVEGFTEGGYLATGCSTTDTTCMTGTAWSTLGAVSDVSLVEQGAGQAEVCGVASDTDEVFFARGDAGGLLEGATWDLAAPGGSAIAGHRACAPFALSSTLLAVDDQEPALDYFDTSTGALLPAGVAPGVALSDYATAAAGDDILLAWSGEGLPGLHLEEWLDGGAGIEGRVHGTEVYDRVVAAANRAGRRGWAGVSGDQLALFAGDSLPSACVIERALSGDGVSDLDLVVDDEGDLLVATLSGGVLTLARYPFAEVCP